KIPEKEKKKHPTTSNRLGVEDFPLFCFVEQEEGAILPVATEVLELQFDPGNGFMILLGSAGLALVHVADPHVKEAGYSGFVFLLAGFEEMDVLFVLVVGDI